MNWVSAGEYQEIGEAGGTPAAVTGQAILSREPIADAATIVFTEQASVRWRLNPMQPRRGGRIALNATIAGIRFFNVHLESGGDDGRRTRQLEEVIAASGQAGDRAVIAGDFNNDGTFQSFMFEGLRRAGFADALGTTPRQTSINHRHPIDWMFVRGGTSTGGRVERVDNTSDHYPVVARISVQQTIYERAVVVHARRRLSRSLANHQAVTASSAERAGTEVPGRDRVRGPDLAPSKQLEGALRVLTTSAARFGCVGRRGRRNGPSYFLATSLRCQDGVGLSSG
jgi:endonuclease/exonuclease/phosphatase family metal-dependent hydrolase